ncbi:MAG TPA: cell division protein FtsZ [Thermodesulfatator sp.]|nr:cell division protein FtsZ [Thermodesulfatator sp.]
MVFELLESEHAAKIKVVGVGGGGGNAINNMIAHKLQGVEFVAANTDYRVLDLSRAPIKIQLGKDLTKGLGAGGDPEVGRQAALEAADQIREALKGADMVFITAGMGGGTGTGAAPVVAEISRELGALTVAVVTKPFAFEGKVRARIAEAGVGALKKVVDTIITIPNDRLISLASPKAKIVDMFRKADEVLYYAVRGISDLIMVPGYVNLDFADVRTVMGEMGLALMGTGVARGENRASEAMRLAISSPLLEDISIKGAKGILINITASSETLTMEEAAEISSLIQAEADEEAKIFWGIVFDDNLEDELRVTVIATGIGEEARKDQQSEKPSIRPVPSTPDDEELPIFKRRSRPKGPEAIKERKKKIVSKPIDEEELEIPTFLRRNAD